MTSRGIREIAVMSYGESNRRRKIVEAIWTWTEHALLVDPDLKPLDETFRYSGNPIQTDQAEFPPGAVVRSDTCSGCGRCLGACPTKAIRKIDGKISIDRTACTACGACAKACPRSAIHVDVPAKAMFMVSAGSQGRMVHGRLMEGSQECANLLRSLMAMAHEEARRFGIETIVIDLPWSSGPLFELVTETCHQRILILDPDVESMPWLVAESGATQFVVPTDDSPGFRFLSSEEMHDPQTVGVGGNEAFP